MDATTIAREISQDRPPSQNQQKQGKPGADHRRAYQACDQCRARKVKCDLGNVDAPRDPPCARCKRESKQCSFQKQRKKVGSGSPPESERNGIHLTRDPSLLAGIAAASNSYGDGVKHEGPVNYNDSPRYNTASISPQPWPDREPIRQHPPPGFGITSNPNQVRNGRSNAPSSYPARVAAMSAPSQFGAGGDHYRNEAVADLLSPTITNPNDALRVLSDAAGQINNQNMVNQTQPSPSTTFDTPSSSGSHYHRGESFSSKQNPRTALGDQALSPGRVDPRLSSAIVTGDEDPIYTQGLQLWSNFKFVRNGWFSSREAMDYIEYYYKHLAPMTPIVIPEFRSPTQHFALLTEEPMLAVTMLTLASRHMPLTGQGALSRAFSIHSNLWSYLRGMIERLFWGQELFGGNGTFGGFGGAPVDTIKPQDPAVTAPKLNWTGSLRSFGTIEALLLLTDWHPRALHFSPGHDESLLDNMRSNLDQQMNGINDGRRDTSGNVQQGRAAFATWLEPAWRSDRMCWMLLGNAMALGFELGLFDKKHRTDPSTTNEQNPPSPTDCPRAQRLRRLLLIYITQNSGRLGITSPLPLREWKDGQSDSISRGQNGSNKRRKIDDSNGTINAMQTCWMEIASIMSESNEQIFPSKEYTTQLIKNGKYHETISKFMPILRNWRAKFDRQHLPEHMRCVLMIEYEYTRLYINSLGLQAVVEGWKHLFKVAADQPDGAPATAGKSGPPGAKLVEVYRDNKEYVEEVADASRSVLRTMLNGFYKDGSLRNAPVRIYFRTLSAAMFLLKTFAFGAREDEVTSSMELLKETSHALRTCVVDDVHLSITIASLLDSLTQSISSRFVRFAVPNNQQSANENDSHESPSREASEQQLAHFQDQEPRPIVPSAFENGAFMPPVDPAYNPYMQGNAMMSHTGGPSSGISGELSSAIPAFDDTEIPPDYYALPLEGFADTFGPGGGGQFGQDIGPPGSSVDDWFQAIINSGTGTGFDPVQNSAGQPFYNPFNSM